MAKLDRITEALERAQAQDLAGASQDSVFRLNAAPLTPVVHKAEFLRGLPGRTAIVYNKTRVANVPRDELVRSRIVVDGADQVLTNAVKLLRTQIVQKMRERGWRTLAIVSPGEGEGKSFMAANFAVSMAAEFDQTVLLLDADLRRPSIHRYFGLSGDTGLSDFLLRRVPLHSILVNPGIERLVILPAGAPQPNSAELLSSTEMAALMADVKARYSDRIVVVDLPPLLHSADALAFAPLVDAMVMVVEDNHSARDDIVRAHQLLAGVNLMGIVMNKSREGRLDVSSYARPNGKDSGILGRLFKRD